MSRLTLRTFKTMAPIERITLFKIPNEADRDRVLEQYKVLAKTATKVSAYCLFYTVLHVFLCSHAACYVQYMYYVALAIRKGVIGTQLNGY